MNGVSKSSRLGERKRQYKGLDFYVITSPINVIVKATFALSPTKKAVMTGKLSFDRHVNSYLYEPEIVISLWTRKKPHIETRVDNGGFYRLEIPVPVPIFQKMLHLALERIWNFKSRKTINQDPEKRRVVDFL